MIDVVNRSMSLVEAGVLTANPRASAYDRITEIGDELDELLEEFKPDAVGLEAGFVKSRKGALTLGAARGVAAFLVRRRKIALREYSPSTVKQQVTGSGKATKAEVALIAARVLGMKNIPGEDEGDALGVAITRARDR